MTRDEQRRDNAVLAIQEAIASHTVAIVAGVGDRELREIGTGTGILFDRRAFILTARHVIDDTPVEALRFFCRPDGPLRNMARDEFRREEGVRYEELHLIEQLPVLNRVLWDEEDLAVLELAEGVEARHRLRLFNFDQGETTPDEGYGIFAMGYPCDIARPIEGGNFVAFPSIETKEIVFATNQNLRGYDSTRHFLASYHMIEDEPTAHPEGFSGCGVWFRVGGTPQDAVWMPNLRMAGVVTHYYDHSILLKAVRVERVSEFLQTIR